MVGKRLTIAIRLSAILPLVISFCFCHELCLDGSPPKDHSENPFRICGKYKESGCCDHAEDAIILSEYEAVVNSKTISQKCGNLIQEILCQKCSPLSAHLFEGGSYNVKRRFPILCHDFCEDLRLACGDMNDILGEEICDDQTANSATTCYPHSDAQGVDEPTDWSKGEDCIPVCLQTVLSQTRNVVGGAFPPDNSNRLFLVEQNGVIWQLDCDRNKLDQPFLDISHEVHQGMDERGLLSMAFHPQFTKNKLFYIFYNPKGEMTRSRIVKMKVSSAGHPMIADEDSAEILLEFSKPSSNHNGGQLVFGHDGYLYISTGDGGGQGDPNGNAQSISTFLGKILRIDVDTPEGYKIPPDNPFVGSTAGEFEEIYAYGLRNPWRMTVDRKTGKIYVGDVGQGRYEEVNIIEKGANYGWRAYEGYSCYDIDYCETLERNHVLTTEPIYRYSHENGWRSVIGGYVYRGHTMTNLQGSYVFGDWVGRNLWALTNTNSKWIKKDLCIKSDQCPEDQRPQDTKRELFAFTEDENGEIYVLKGNTRTTAQNEGVVFKLTPPIRI